MVGAICFLVRGHCKAVKDCVVILEGSSIFCDPTFSLLLFIFMSLHSGVPWVQSAKTQSCESFFFFFRPGICLNTALHASRTARNSAFIMSIVLVHFTAVGCFFCSLLFFLHNVSHHVSPNPGGRWVTTD